MEDSRDTNQIFFTIMLFLEPGCGQYRRNPAATSIWWLLLSFVTVHMGAAIKASSSDSSFSVVSYLPEVRTNAGPLGRACESARNGVH